MHLKRPPEPSQTKPLKQIDFKHPNYPDITNTFLTLHCYDSEQYSDNINELGVHYGTAITACGILVGNIWEGRLSKSLGRQLINLEDDDILTEDIYYYYHPTEGQDYYLIPEFSQWRFPHGNLPQSWTATYVSRKDAQKDTVPSREHKATQHTKTAVEVRDKYCCLSSHGDDMEAAHLIPKAHYDWFVKNGMQRYNINGQLRWQSRIGDPANVIALRQDIHNSFDRRIFAIVPKYNTWVAHFLSDTVEKGEIYHNTVIPLHWEIPAEFLFARFAWAITFQVKEFLVVPDSKRPIQYRISEEEEPTKSKLDPIGIERLGFFITSKRNSSTQGNTPGESASPTKRSRQDGTSESTWSEDSIPTSLKEWEETNAFYRLLYLATERKLQGEGPDKKIEIGDQQIHDEEGTLRPYKRHRT